MKLILLSLFFLSFGLEAMAALPTGTVKISIYRSEIVNSDGNYDWNINLVCEETLPIQVIDGRHNNNGFGMSHTCQFKEKGISYTAYSYYQVALKNLAITGNRDMLSFSSSIWIKDENFETPPFVYPAPQSFFTLDQNLKNAVMLLNSDQGTVCNLPKAPQNGGAPNCEIINPIGYNAVFEYVLH